MPNLKTKLQKYKKRGGHGKSNKDSDGDRVASQPSARHCDGGEVITADPSKHFHPKGKMPSKFTIELQNGLRKNLWIIRNDT
jgi:hypothetical protein